jgi:glycosyltransferase involved in cell wall biosynthesis
VVCVDRGAAPDRVAGADVSEHYAHGDRDGAARALEAIGERLGGDLRDRARRHAERRYDWNRTFEALTSLYEGLATRRA